ncbi:hypothetical protein QR685DRAFT_548178 [Neurospora intermedia]|uniref:Uncharacterized protein n=1 Tax=Neurospora intermedia TaxID=5142 RepID=A0ABR3D0C6_NEUIN
MPNLVFRIVGRRIIPMAFVAATFYTFNVTTSIAVTSVRSDGHMKTKPSSPKPPSSPLPPHLSQKLSLCPLPARPLSETSAGTNAMHASFKGTRIWQNTSTSEGIQV